jgi:transposase-like protein
MRGRSEKIMRSEVYSKEFKDAAVKKVIKLGPSKAAKELGLPVSTIFGWSKMYGMSSSMKTKKNKISRQVDT